jgi:hypothetical protein
LGPQIFPFLFGSRFKGRNVLDRKVGSNFAAAMSLGFLIDLLLIVGFVAAPFASLRVQRSSARISAAILLTTTLSVLACFAYAFDRSIVPISVLWCVAAMLMGVAICARVFIRHKARFALILGAALVGTIAGLHFFGVDFPRTCLRVQSSIQIDMTVEQVQSLVLREFAKCANYHVVVGPTVSPDRDFRMQFDLRPEYVNLSGGILEVDFVRGRSTQARTTFEGIWIAPWDLLLGIILCAICCWRVGSAAEGEAAPRDDIVAVFGRLHHVRALGHRFHSGKSAILVKRDLMHSASEKVRQAAYFDRSTSESEAKEVVAEDD